MKKYSAILVAIALVLCMVFASCAPVVEQVTPNEPTTDASVGQSPSASITTPSVPRPQGGQKYAPKGEYNKGVVLVKNEKGVSKSALTDVSYKSVEPLYDGSTWYKVTLNASQDTEKAVETLATLGIFEEVDYDYIMKADGEVQSIDISGNGYAPDPEHLETLGVHKAWLNSGGNNHAPGGSPDVVVAVIDTGVDYNHEDLRNNIWYNPAEIPDNGIDDDNNGYVDDVRGWDCVGNDNDPMDDNGHGTHVAGIVAAENNKVGTVGVAFNCKVMVLKAGTSSGYFNNSDIAEAIRYAYMNGASVINMSFGGSAISIPVEDALMDAYNQCVLVAAAGNDNLCNNLSCSVHYPAVGVCYPAALPYVIGVMSCDNSGSYCSGFSNFDHNPNNSVEYEIYAPGEAIPSTWPGNKYARLNGTSMASPTVAGIAALLRSYYTDREVYSNKFIQSQIVNTGTQTPVIDQYTMGEHTVADAYLAMTQIPKPNVNFYDYSIDDSTSISTSNNGNGVVDAGETIRLYVSLHNKGGVATNVNVSIDTIRSTDPSITDPYFTFANSTIQLSDIGTYSVRESGDKYFEIVVSSDCPNDYLADFNIRFTYENGLDETDTTIYKDDGKQKAQFSVSRGFLLPSNITEDTVYTADRLYIVGQDVVIPEGVTVTFEEGCEIQFYDDREYYNSPIIKIYGVLDILGSKDNLVCIFPSEKHQDFVCRIRTYTGGSLNVDYLYGTNVDISDSKYDIYSPESTNVSSITNSYFVENGARHYNASQASKSGNTRIWADYIENISLTSVCCNLRGARINSSVIVINEYYFEIQQALRISGSFTNNILITNSAESIDFSGYIDVSNNFFYGDSVETLSRIRFSTSTTHFLNNEFSTEYQQYASQVIENYYDSTGNPTVDVYGSLADASLLWPHVVSVEMFDKDGNPITTIGKEEIKVRVTFNRPMDKDAGTFLTFGTSEPYADYRIDGEYVSDTVWEGTYTLKAQIENGQNFLKVNDAWAAEDKTKTVFGEYQLHEFSIDTTAAMSMNLQANATEKGIELTFVQDDYDTLLGYNIYRSTEKDGNYVKLNPAILLPNESTFLDENAEPGKTYWYTYTVVLTDFTESNPAGKVMATALDTLAPNMYHTPVNQGYMNNNLVISCTASDNVAISTVKLYYRTVGATEWKTLTMSKQSDKYSATIFGSELTLDGIEYYIVATDGRNTINKGSAEAPYTVVIKDASAISRKGDVDGDGVVTTKDALMLMQCINGDLILTDDQFKRADLNGDGVLNSSEALRILQYINGKVSTLEM